ncbi:hypothetical protein [Rhizobium sp. RM]|uniref:hypothetical protein n=1 Tax=Rhizobium sp. RM TaxID=2748079 RepID=UPI00110E6026|nr:hypothetical protein [Rhizobium sp. RM]NWJ25529.1 hypothetical protein [Rhizobium sp. RM]TMV22156.1 hypothetical protein BJG94_03190 [Rhizobium sp. Td3]
MTASCWALLEIDPTNDEGIIRRAYARRLRDFRPDEDPVGFQRLVEARTAAITQAKWQTARDEDAGAAQQGEHENASHASPDVRVLVAGEDGLERIAPETGHQRKADYSSLFAQVSGEAFDNTRDAKTLFDSLEDLLAECREKRTKLPSDAFWTAGPWAAFFDRAASELDLNSYDALIAAVARGMYGLFPPCKDQELKRLDDYAAGHGIAAVVNAIERAVQFSERGDFLFDACGAASAQIYFEWADIARQGNDILHRNAVGRKAYFKGKIPLVPIDDQPHDVGESSFGRYHRKALENGRWPWVFNPLRALCPAYVVARHIDAKIGLSLLVLSLMAAILPLVSQTSNYMVAGISCLLSVAALRVWLAFCSKKLLLNRLIHRVIGVDRKKIWSRTTRYAEINAQIPKRLDVLGALLTMIEFGSLLFALLFVGIQAAHIWEVRHLYAEPAEQIIVDTVVPVLEGPAHGFGLEYSRFFEFFSSIQSDRSEGVPLRSLGVNTTAGGLSNKLWLPRIFMTNEGVLTKLNTSSIELYSRQNRAGGPVSIKLWWNEQRDEKLRALSLLYRAGDPALRVSIEEMLLQFSALIHRPLDDQTALTQQLLWKVMPPRDQSSLSEADEDMFQAIVLRHFMGQVSNPIERASELELFSQFYWLLNAKGADLVESLALRKYSLVAEINVQSLEYGNLPSDRLLKNLLQSWLRDPASHVVFPSRRQSSFQQFEPSEIIKFPNIEVSIARRAFFEIASSLLNETSPARVREFLTFSLGRVPLELHPDDANFWTTAAVNFISTISRSGELDFPMRTYLRNSNEEVEILVLQLMARAFQRPK